MTYLQIFKRFNELSLDYLVVGGLAVNFHGIPRMTYDIDIMIRMSEPNIIKLVNQLQEWGYRPRVPVNPLDLARPEQRQQWLETKGMKAFSFYHDQYAIAEIDIVFYSPIPYDDLKRNAVNFDLSGVPIPTVGIEDLIRLKSAAGRKQDLADVENLKKLLK